MEASLGLTWPGTRHNARKRGATNTHAYCTRGVLSAETRLSEKMSEAHQHSAADVDLGGQLDLMVRCTKAATAHKRIFFSACGIGGGAKRPTSATALDSCPRRGHKQAAPYTSNDADQKQRKHAAISRASTCIQVQMCGKTLHGLCSSLTCGERKTAFSLDRQRVCFVVLRAGLSARADTWQDCRTHDRRNVARRCVR